MAKGKKQDKDEPDFQDVARIAQRGRATAEQRRQRRPVKLNELQDRSEMVRRVTRDAVAAAQAVPQQRKLLGLTLPSFVLLAVALAAVLLAVILWPRQTEYTFEGQEFRGVLDFEQGGKLEVRLDLDRAPLDPRKPLQQVSGALTVLEPERMPALLRPGFDRAAPLRVAGPRNPITGNFRYTVSGASGPLARKLELNGIDTFSTDLKSQQLEGTLLIDDQISGRFKLRRPRHRNGG